jgi:diaminohydroxyphosphoribosylaminopyrimidine deaminase/5-amino-6-(5-phosphoribosylamino)uracil reductase
MVGALIVDPEGRVIAEGWHQGAGTAHAEVEALGRAGSAAAGGTVYTTLEPCNRFGRTPPCSRALIDAGVARVIVGSIDPNLGPGAPGIAELTDAGIEVETGVCADEEAWLNRAFRSRVTTGRPWVVLKMAGSLDGKAAASDGTSRWITGEAARDDVQRLRAWADAIVVGAGTALADDPRLTVRSPAHVGAHAPLRIVVDATGRVPPGGAAFSDEAPTLVATTDLAPRAARAAWEDAGAEVLTLDRDARGGVSLDALVEELGKRELQGLLLEGGPTLAWSAIRDDLVDELVLYLAPVLVGGASAPTLLDGEGFTPIGGARPVTVRAVERLGDDLRVEARVHRDR